ncbi:sensor histidine kinase [Caulobacter hibisci]|uniref:histidine kinase n=1 Tax=Caulobacter hibisci TaxID=2035993 RepID=A0ABS0SSZ2_9CAUL|nr:ATP-binding protein [Caulobacter hibisci]MBI1682772.1 PAS domain-containing protein [Caulobacter hibisci]
MLAHPFPAPTASPLGRRLRLGGAAAIAAAVFVVDTFTPLSSAVAVLYVLVPLLVGEDLTGRRLWGVTLACAALATISFAVSHGRAPQLAPTLRLLVSLAALGVAALLTGRNQQARRTLTLSEARYRTIFNTLAISIWEHDFRPVKAALDGLRAQGVTDLADHLARHPELVRQIKATVRITDVNATALTMMGVADKADFFERLDQLLPETDETFAQFLLAFDEGRPSFETETVVRSRTGELIPVIVALNFPPHEQGLDRVQASIVNLTERRRMQERLDRARAELEQALRAATLGVLSASIAHEVNQPLAAISNAAGAAQRWLDRETPDLEEAKDAVADVVTAAAHAAEVVRGIRGLIAQAPAERAPLAVDGLLAASASFVAREVAEHGVELVLAPEAGDTMIQGDRVVLQQALVNLMLNGVQAMAGGPTRRLLARARREGDEAVIEIADTGPGFSPEAAERAFEAFYTTKSSGMGLGLAICQSAVAAHDGRIAILSPLEGTTGARIEIRLPAA